MRLYECNNFKEYFLNISKFSSSSYIRKKIESGEGSKIASWLEFTVKIGCSNNCYFCPQEKTVKAYSNRGPKYLSYQNFCTILKKLPKDVGLHFSGFSEPFLNPEASKMIRTASEKGYKIQLFTTLVSLKPNDVENIKNIKFERFYIHLPDKKFFRYPTDRWLENYRLIASADLHPQFMTMGELDKRIEKIVGKLEAAKMLSRAGTVEHIKVKRKAGKLFCRRLTQRGNVIIPNGDVYLCCMDFKLQYKLGNLLTGKYDDLFKGEEFKRVLKAVNSENEEVICRYCEKAKVI